MRDGRSSARRRTCGTRRRALPERRARDGRRRSLFLDPLPPRPSVGLPLDPGHRMAQGVEHRLRGLVASGRPCASGDSCRRRARAFGRRGAAPVSRWGWQGIRAPRRAVGRWRRSRRRPRAAVCGALPGRGGVGVGPRGRVGWNRTALGPRSLRLRWLAVHSGSRGGGRGPGVGKGRAGGFLTFLRLPFGGRRGGRLLFFNHRRGWLRDQGRVEALVGFGERRTARDRRPHARRPVRRPDRRQSTRGPLQVLHANPPSDTDAASTSPACSRRSRRGISRISRRDQR